MERICQALERSSATTFILSGINLARLEMLSVIKVENNHLVSFHRDQDLVPTTLLMYATTVVLSMATRTLGRVGC